MIVVCARCGEEIDEPQTVIEVEDAHTDCKLM